MKKYIRSFLAGLLYIICNYLICNIPSWTIRKLLYKSLGMKIGNNSRIMMKTIVTIPWKITIGNNTIVNEHCYLDGRGGLTIGNNVNIALYTMLITGTHDYLSSKFKFYTEKVEIEDYVWTGARALILNGCVLQKGCIIGAGSVVSPGTTCQADFIYSGTPAKAIKKRDLKIIPNIEKWIVFFR